jgi:transposase
MANTGSRPETEQQTISGVVAHAQNQTLHSCRVGALPLLQRILERMKLLDFLRTFLLPADRCRLDPARGVVLLLNNILIARVPLYGIAEWAARYDPAVLGIDVAELPLLNDDRIGRCLDRLFRADVPSMVLALATHIVREFAIDLSELHNDSTTITFHGAYSNARQEEKRGARTRLAITWGYNKDHRPDLKQLLYILTVARDGSIPLTFQVQSGNVADDQTHRATWDLLCQLTGRCDFLYVADCKLASAENMAYIHHRQGKFLTVLPRTRAEDTQFRERLTNGQVQWRHVYDKTYDHGNVIDCYSIAEPPATSVEGYRLVWYHSTRKAEHDADVRQRQIERAFADLAELRAKLSSPRTRYRQRAKVEEAVEEILQAHGVARWIVTGITEQIEETFHQESRGRPGPDTRYVRETRGRFVLEYHVVAAQLTAETVRDGVFPLITNDQSLSELEMLQAYKRQPSLEKRFSHLKTDFEVAPVFLKETSRIQALLCVYFLALLAESLLEREVRRSMKRKEIASLPLYPEGRACRYPTARCLIDEFEDVQRHWLRSGDQAPVVFTSELSARQQKLLRLLGMANIYDV